MKWKGVVIMHKLKGILLSLSALFSAAAIFFRPAVAYAADAPVRHEKINAPIIIVLVLIFAVTLISSTIITYKIRTKNIKNDAFSQPDDKTDHDKG